MFSKEQLDWLAIVVESEIDEAQTHQSWLRSEEAEREADKEQQQAETERRIEIGTQVLAIVNLHRGG